MGKILAYILAMLFALLALFLLGLFIVTDIIRTREYMKASRTTAKISGYGGRVKTANYGLLQPATRYHQYDVCFMVDGQTCRGKYLCKKAGLGEGDQVEVRYVRTADHTIKIVNRDIKDRFFRMLLCAAAAIFLSGVYILFYR